MGSSFHAAKRGIIGMMCVAVMPTTGCSTIQPSTQEAKVPELTFDMDTIMQALGDSQDLLDRGFRDVTPFDIQNEWRQYFAKFGYRGNRCTITVINNHIKDEDVYDVNHSDNGAEGLPVSGGWNWLAYRNNTGGPIWNPTIAGFRSDPTLSWCFQPGPPDRP